MSRIVYQPDIEIRGSDECLVCLDREPDTVVLPCYHRVVCRDCSQSLHHSIHDKKCILCQQTIVAVLE